MVLSHRHMIENMSTEYSPYDDRSQMLREIDKYGPSFKRVPTSPLIERPLTLSERTGPVELPEKWNVGKLDLSRSVPAGRRALGQLIQVTGRVTDEDGSPVSSVCRK